MISALDYAEQQGLPVGDVIEKIRTGQLEGIENDRGWFVKSSDDNEPQILRYERPGSSQVLNVFAVFTILVGLLGAFVFLVNDKFGFGVAISWLLVCTLQCTLFVALAQIVNYLSKIEFNTRTNKP